MIVALGWSPALAQAPASANLWRVGTASLTTPPALQTGPVGITWNPTASSVGSGLDAAILTIQTSDVVGLSGYLVGITRQFVGGSAVSINAGRVDVRDLVQTTTSPSSEGTIPVFSQFLGLAGSASVGPILVGGAVRLHDARFHVVRENGLTFDLGASIAANSRLRIALATHFLPIDLSGEETTDYYGGVEYVIAPNVSVGSVGAQIVAMYGVTYRAAETLEHMVGGQMVLGGFFRVGAGIVREATQASHGWRASVAISALVGRYVLEIARSNGLNDLGATYRIGLRAKIL